MEYKISRIWSGIQKTLFPLLEDEIGPLSERHKKLIAILELISIEDFIIQPWWNLGRPVKDRAALARAFVAKMVYKLSTTVELIDRLHADMRLRRISGWKRPSDIPSEATFSRAYAEFATGELPQRVHEVLIGEHYEEKLVGHLSRDSTDIVGREKATVRPKKQQPTKRKRGRPRKGEEREKELTRLQKQSSMTLSEMLSDLPGECNYGTKKKLGKTYHWKGYKLHVDFADGEVPISCILTSASLHDSQAAIPLAALSAGRVTSLYDLMDAAYDAEAIREYSIGLGHVPLIDVNRRRKEKTEMEPAAKRRFTERSTAERGFSLLKECFDGNSVMVRGPTKVMAHLMFGIVALTAERLLNMVV